MTMESKCWSTLPDHIVVHFLSYLTLVDKYRVSQVCSAWNNCFKSHYIWQRFEFQFLKASDSRFLQCVKTQGKFLRHVSIDVDQSIVENRENACAVIKSLALTDKRFVESFKIRFTGQNPLFYAGTEFLSCLKDLFGAPPESVKPRCQLRRVDLSGLMAAMDEELLDLLSTNNPTLEKLNIQSKTLVCKISPDCIMRLLSRCRRLTDLRLHNYSVSEDVVLAFTEDNRVSLKHLAIKYRREEKYCKELSSEVWSKLARFLPELRVTLGFDHTCPFHKIWSFLKPEIPVSELLLTTYTRIYDELNLATDFYQNTLEKVVMNTVYSPELERALIKMSQNCKKLHSLYIYSCILPTTVVEEILNNCSKMREKGSYAFQTSGAPEWTVVGVENGD